MSLLLAGVLLFIALLSASFVWSFRKNEFMESEASRILNNYCEVDDNWSSNGRIYTKGFTVIEENGKQRFVKQAKLCDAGILS